MTDTSNKVEQYNLMLRDCKPQEIIYWALNQSKQPVMTTSFGKYSAALLHMVVSIEPKIPVIWVDSGYNTDTTYRFALQLIEKFQLQIKIYTPKYTSSFLHHKLQGIPEPDTLEHKEFAQIVKLEPFKRAIQELKPDAWLTGIRQEETQYRKSLDIVIRQRRGLFKIAPLFYWSEMDLKHYIDCHELPIGSNYFDPTKMHEGRECGLHTHI